MYAPDCLLIGTVGNAYVHNVGSAPALHLYGKNARKTGKHVAQKRGEIGQRNSLRSKGLKRAIGKRNQIVHHRVEFGLAGIEETPLRLMASPIVDGLTVGSGFGILNRDSKLFAALRFDAHGGQHAPAFQEINRGNVAAALAARFGISCRVGSELCAVHVVALCRALTNAGDLPGASVQHGFRSRKYVCCQARNRGFGRFAVRSGKRKRGRHLVKPPQKPKQKHDN